MTSAEIVEMSKIFCHVKALIDRTVDDATKLNVFWSTNSDGHHIVVVQARDTKTLAQAIGRRGVIAKSVRCLLIAVGMARFGKVIHFEVRNRLYEGE